MLRKIFQTELKFRAWLFSLDSVKKRFIQITCDSFIAPISLLMAFFMRLEMTDYFFHFDTYIGILIVMAVTLSVFYVRGQYNNVTRYISMETVYNVAIGSIISSAALLLGIFFLDLEIPRSVPLIYATLFCLFATSIRFFVRALGQNLTAQKSETVAIFGTGADSVQLIEALRKNTNYRVRLLIDDDSKMYGRNIGGIPIFKLDDAVKKIRELEVNILLLAVPGDIQVIRRRILDVLSEHPLKIKKIPSISSLIAGGVNISDLKDIKIEDLLGRKSAECSPKLMEKTITGKIVFVTGAGGSIGSELSRQIVLWKPQKLILLDISEYAIYKLLKELDQYPDCQKIELFPLVGSVQDRQFIKKIFDRFSVDTTYHAAAYKHVPLMEQNVMQCIKNNVFGTLNMAELAIEANVKNFVLVSTDKAVNPTNFMGASKRFAEIICKTMSTKKSQTSFSIVRFGNVLGSSGSVVPLFKKQIENGGPITLTHLDITRYFMTISEASQLVIQAASIAKGGDIFVLDMGKPIKILELAKRMVALSGLQPILNGKENLKQDEIAIIVNGLRPGEKLFEELSYCKNLKGTVHPKIKSTAETPVSCSELQSLLTALSDAIHESDHKKLYLVISKVANGVSRLSESCDAFIE